MSAGIKSTPKIRINGIDIYYELHGCGAPIVLIAGFSCDHNFWSAIVAELAKHHQVLLFDNRGIGRTDAPDSAYTIELMADDVMALIKILKIKKPVIVGQSMGSAIAQLIAKKYEKDITKLILINTFNQLTKVSEVVFDLIGNLLRIKTPLKYCVQTIAPWVYSSEFLSQPSQLQRLIDQAEANPYPQSIIGYQRQLDALKSFCSNTWLNEIKVKTLVIAAKEDLIAPLTSAQIVANSIGTKAALLMIPGGHASPIEQPLESIKAILDFIKH